MSLRGIVFSMVVASALGSGRSLTGEAEDIHDWGQVARLRSGTHVWVRTRDAPLAELVIARVTEEAMRAGVVSAIKNSTASEKQILSRCAAPTEDKLVVGGELVDFTSLCRTLSRDAVLEVHIRKRKSPLRSILIGSGITAAIMFYPCGVAPQANGSAAGCRLGAAAGGALIGWAAHGLGRGERVLIYEAKEAQPAWDEREIEREWLALTHLIRR